VESSFLIVIIGLLYPFISSTHKRTEGRATVWGSDFTSKDAAIQVDPEEAAATLNVELCDLPAW
jgi:hypothetical protein